MKITFLGAAQTVTGSCYILSTANNRFTIDCGMHQGNDAIEERNSNTSMYQPKEIDFILLTHAHIDHSGLIPKLVAEGFTGPIYCTPATADLVSIMLEDSAHIQEMEYIWSIKQAHRKGLPTHDLSPLYTMEDAKKAVTLLHPVDFNTPFEPAPEVKFTFHYAGHILGAAFLHIEVKEQDKTTRLTFSGDLGRPNALLMHDPENIPKTDYVFLESTYGNRNHRGESDTMDELAEAVAYSYSRGGKVIIPAFAVERTQEILYSLILLRDKGKIPKDMPIYLDSPLAIRATDIFMKYADELDMDDNKRDLTAIKDTKFNIHYSLTTQESQALNIMKGPAIILSASGMCNAGRVKHHLKHNIWNENSCVVFVGYQAVGTLGRRIVEGAKTVKLFNNELKVAAKIFTIGGFSAHAGQSQLLDWLSTSTRNHPHVVLIHGEIVALETLAQLIRKQFHLTVTIPDYLEEMHLTLSGKSEIIKSHVDVRPPVDWTFILDDMDTKLRYLRQRQKSLSELSWEDQMDLRDQIAEINKELYVFLSRT